MWIHDRVACLAEIVEQPLDVIWWAERLSLFDAVLEQPLDHCVIVPPRLTQAGDRAKARRFILRCQQTYIASRHVT